PSSATPTCSSPSTRSRSIQSTPLMGIGAQPADTRNSTRSTSVVTCSPLARPCGNVGRGTARIDITSTPASPHGDQKTQKPHFFLVLVVRVVGLGGSEVTITVNGHPQIVQLEQEWPFGIGRTQRRRPWFCCPACGRHCRTLHEKNGTSVVCRRCSGYDFR